MANSICNVTKNMDKQILIVTYLIHKSFILVHRKHVAFPAKMQDARYLPLCLRQCSDTRLRLRARASL